MATRQFQPFTIEITKQLDVSEADEKAIAKFRENPFRDEDSLLQMAVGSQLAAKDIIILWGKWREFVQKISAEAAVQVSNPEPIRIEEVTRRYRVQPG